MPIFKPPPLMAMILTILQSPTRAIGSTGMTSIPISPTWVPYTTIRINSPERKKIWRIQKNYNHQGKKQNHNFSLHS